MDQQRRARRAGRLNGLDLPALLLREIGPDASRGLVVLGYAGAVAQAAGVAELVLGEGEEVIEPRFMKFPAFAAPAKTCVNSQLMPGSL